MSAGWPSERHYGASSTACAKVRNRNLCADEHRLHPHAAHRVRGGRIRHAHPAGRRGKQNAKGIRRAGGVSTEPTENAFSGHIFAFRGRRGDKIKMLWWNGDACACLPKGQRHQREKLAALQGLKSSSTASSMFREIKSIAEGK